ncbi:hypothetical protein SteCoe_26506 [Stentor coeruleus]|uniref:Geranylgeranyl transferase type-2 subunit alpha n=1 Tax=Stentor coeruleus TaxID=5963 RepID=A0A1R2BD31_9CILI|nr:hypothetical protein SteCoe_26506 [Stentor coeruleus]
MHSRKKRLIPPTVEEIASEKLRLEKIQKLHKLVFTEIESESFTDEGFTLSEKAMMISPDIYTFLNFRRNLLLSKLSQVPKEDQVKILSSELELLTRIIKDSPKSYTLWFHRQWVLLQCQNVAEIMTKELALCDYMLKKDNRNFHVWNYRSWVVALEGNQGVNDEMEFTKTMIYRDFSNFSAWHYRTKVVKQKFPDQVPVEFIISELSMLKNAYFTCPNDQSVWNYHRWLLLGLENIKIVGISPRTYKTCPNELILGFSHSLSGLDSQSVGVSDGWEPAEGTWEPLHTKPFSYIWKFIPSKPFNNAVEIRLNPVNTQVCDFNKNCTFTNLIYKYKKANDEYEFKADGQEDIEIFEQELANINELLDIEEEDINQVLLRKAQIVEVLAFSVPVSGYFDQAVDCYKRLIQKDPRHKVFYEEQLDAFTALKLYRKSQIEPSSLKLKAKLLGLG